jgi:hypothetical protein
MVAPRTLSCSSLRRRGLGTFTEYVCSMVIGVLDTRKTLSARNTRVIDAVRNHDDGSGIIGKCVEQHILHKVSAEQVEALKWLVE